MFLEGFSHMIFFFPPTVFILDRGNVLSSLLSLLLRLKEVQIEIRLQGVNSFNMRLLCVSIFLNFNYFSLLCL